MTLPTQVADARRARAQRLREQPVMVGTVDHLPDPSRDHRAYLAALRTRMRAYLARLTYAEAWISNRKAHVLAISGGDARQAGSSEAGDQDLAYWKAQRDRSHDRVRTMAAAILAEVETKDIP